MGQEDGSELGLDVGEVGVIVGMTLGLDDGTEVGVLVGEVG